MTRYYYRFLTKLHGIKMTYFNLSKRKARKIKRPEDLSYKNCPFRYAPWACNKELECEDKHYCFAKIQDLLS